MKRIKIIHLLKSEHPVDDVLVKGWIRTKRDLKDFSFLEVNDGSCLKNIQIVVDSTLNNYKDIIKISTGSAVAIRGKLEESRGPGQNRGHGA